MAEVIEFGDGSRTYFVSWVTEQTDGLSVEGERKSQG